MEATIIKGQVVDVEDTDFSCWMSHGTQLLDFWDNVRTSADLERGWLIKTRTRSCSRWDWKAILLKTNYGFVFRCDLLYLPGLEYRLPYFSSSALRSIGSQVYELDLISSTKQATLGKIAPLYMLVLFLLIG